MSTIIRQRTVLNGRPTAGMSMHVSMIHVQPVYNQLAALIFPAWYAGIGRHSTPFESKGSAAR